MRIRLLRLLSRLNVGGPSHHVITLTHDLRAFGFDTTLGVGVPPSSEGDMFAEARREGIEPHLIQGLNRQINPSLDARAFVEILRLIQHLRPHIVHTHTTKAGVLGRLAAIIGRVPIIVHTFHGHVFSGYFSKLGSATALHLERLLAAKTDRLVTLSPSLREELLQKLRPSHPQRVRVIPLGLPLHKFVNLPRRLGKFRRYLGLDDTTFLLGIVARLAPVKNHFLLIEAFTRICRQHPNLHLVVVGGGELASLLRLRVEKLGLSRLIHFTGIFHPIEDVYSDLDLLVLTSHNEGTPVVLLEGLASGCPVAATNVGGVADVFREVGFGTLLPGNVDALAQALSKIITDYRFDSSIPFDIRMKTARLYSRKNLAERTAELYRPLLERRVPEYLNT